jgi:hypothetical protein
MIPSGPKNALIACRNCEIVKRVVHCRESGTRQICGLEQQV